MRTRVQRWGNSLAVRIPKAYASEVGLQEESPVEIRLQQGKLIVQPSIPPTPKLEDLLRLIRKSNLHREVDTGPAQGDEAW